MNRLSFSFKLYFLSFFLITTVLIIGGSGVYITSHLNNSLEFEVYKTLPVMRNLTLIDMAHDGIRGAALESMLGVVNHDLELIKNSELDLHDHQKNVLEQIAIIKSKISDKELKNETAIAEKKVADYIQNAQSLINNAKKYDIESSNSDMKLFQSKFDELETYLESYGDKVQSYSENNSNESIKFSKRSQSINISVILISSIFGLFLSIYITKSLSKQINDITKKIYSGANEVGESSQKLSRASINVAESSNEQAAAIQETSASIAEISSMVKRSADSANNSTLMTTDSRDKAEKGQELVRQTISSMDKIKKNNENIELEIKQTNDQISEITKMIQDISEKTKIIDDIVFQTKLLSFNASVEAARAGEHGKGFAVVAEEVGNLAQMSGNAAKEISSVVDESVKKVEDIIRNSTLRINTLVQSAKIVAEEGSETVKDCGVVLNDVVESSSSVSSMVISIAEATKEQATGVEEISKAVHLLDTATQLNANAANEFSNAAKSMSEEALKLKIVSEQLHAVVHGEAKDRG